jgi:hypothetical protein
MPLLAGDVIDSARDRHAEFDPRRQPDKMLLRTLSDYVAHLSGRITAIDPDALRIEESYELPLADFDAGIALPANRYIAEIVAKDPDTAARPRSYPVALIGAEQRFARNGPLAAAWQIGDRLYLRGPAETWRFMGSIAVAYVAQPVALATLEDVLALPDSAKLACTEYLALFMARRAGAKANPPIAIETFASAASGAESALIEDVKNRLTGRVFFTEDVWP